MRRFALDFVEVTDQALIIELETRDTDMLTGHGRSRSVFQVCRGRATLVFSFGQSLIRSTNTFYCR